MTVYIFLHVSTLKDFPLFALVTDSWPLISHPLNPYLVYILPGCTGTQGFKFNVVPYKNEVGVWFQPTAAH